MTVDQRESRISTRRASQIAWAVFGVALALWAVDMVFLYLTRNVDQNTNWSLNNLVASLAFAVTMLAFPLAGALIAVRRPDSPIGWLLLLIGICWGIANDGSPEYGLLLHPGTLAGSDYLAPITAAMWVPPIGISGTFLFLLFPDGRLPSRRWRWVAWLSALTIVVGTLALILTPGLLTDAGYPHTVNPLGVRSLWPFLDYAQGILALLPVCMVLSAASLVVRYRRADLVEREQITWLAAAGTVVAVTYAIVLPLSLLAPAGTAPAWLQVAQGIALLSFGLIPAAILVAVLRYHLFEIDVIIRRTLTYALLLAALAAVYAVGIWVLGTALRSVTGASGTVAVAVSTLAVWGVFQPLRSRVQRLVERRFARERYDPERVLADLSSRLRDRIELESIERDLLDVVGTAVQPRHVSLWMRPDSQS